MGGVIGRAVGRDHHAGQKAGDQGEETADDEGDKARAPAALDQIAAPIGGRPIEGEAGEERLQKGGRGLGGEAGIGPARRDHRAPRLLQQHLHG